MDDSWGAEKQRERRAGDGHDRKFCRGERKAFQNNSMKTFFSLAGDLEIEELRFIMLLEELMKVGIDIETVM